MCWTGSVTGMVLTLRPMIEDDLALVRRWLGEPHVARWWPEPAETELRGYARCLAGDEPTFLEIVEVDGLPVGWAQWYRWHDYSDDAFAYGAGEHDIGIDYALGELSATGRGVGTAMVAALVAQVRARYPGADLLTDVAPDNHASRRVLEHGGFVPVETRVVAAEPCGTVVMYRLSARSP